MDKIMLKSYLICFFLSASSTMSKCMSRSNDSLFTFYDALFKILVSSKNLTYWQFLSMYVWTCWRSCWPLAESSMTKYFTWVKPTLIWSISKFKRFSSILISSKWVINNTNVNIFIFIIADSNFPRLKNTICSMNSACVTSAGPPLGLFWWKA